MVGDELRTVNCPRDGSQKTVHGCEGCDRLKGCWTRD
ncbi:MAG: hypothetical protein MAG715_00903 [Methanonatronarchaeales archaeon]|nr:hypothetical protein [Methanonatronarchaeales archaeon]